MIKSGYVDSKGRKHHQVTTHFEPDKAREAFPCFDEPSFRVRWSHVTCHPLNDSYQHKVRFIVFICQPSLEFKWYLKLVAQLYWISFKASAFYMLSFGSLYIRSNSYYSSILFNCWRHIFRDTVKILMNGMDLDITIFSIKFLRTRVLLDITKFYILTTLYSPHYLTGLR